MKIEIERLFWDVKEDELRNIILDLGGTSKAEKTLYKRVVKSFGQVDGLYSWMRLRDEGSKTVLTLKQRKDDESYSGESEVEVSDFETLKKIMEFAGINFNSYQENYRESFILNECEVSIDIWPFLEPVCEIEGSSEEKVLETGKMLNLNFDNSFNKNISSVYKMKYGKYITELSEEKQKMFYFGAENPFN